MDRGEHGIQRKFPRRNMPEILLGVLGFYLLWVLSEVFRYGMKSVLNEH